MIRRLIPVAAFIAVPAQADDLYRRGNWAALATDRRASEVGDMLTVTIFQTAEASHSAQNSTRKSTDVAGSIRGGGIAEGGSIGFGGGYTGRGETRRSERLVAQLSVVVAQVLPNGDMVIVGRQKIRVNGENTDIGVRGRIRSVDIGADNTVLSSRIADAEIDYGGRGFVSRGAKPGILNRIFSLLGLG